MTQLEMFNDPREQTVAEMVREFKETAEQNPTVEMSLKLVQEEFLELLESMNNDNPVEELKELADCVYVAYGLADTLDVDLSEVSVEQAKEDLGFALRLCEYVGFTDKILTELGVSFGGIFNPQVDTVSSLRFYVDGLFAYARDVGVDLQEAVKRVHANNIGRMIQPDGTIKRREDGKILKNKDYPKVDLSDLV